MSIKLKSLVPRGLREDTNVLDQTVKNPDTGHDIKVSTAMGYGKSHPAYAAASAKIKKASGVTGGPTGDSIGTRLKRAAQFRPDYKISGHDELVSTMTDVVKNARAFDIKDAYKVVRNFHDMPLPELIKVHDTLKSSAHSVINNYKDMSARVKSGEIKSAPHIKKALTQLGDLAVAFNYMSNVSSHIYVKRKM